MLKKYLIASALFSVMTLATAAQTACPSHYLNGQAPEFTNQKLASKTKELCFEVFGVMHSGVTRTPLWSAEHLTKDHVEAAQHQSRENSFHPESQIPFGERAELKDYSHSGFDRGHMAPNGDMPDRKSQHESFSLANMVPQNSVNNRQTWAGIEGEVRHLAKKEGELYVISGPVFIGSKIQKIGNVLVPTHLYKLVYSPEHKEGAAFFIENTADSNYQIISIAEVEKKIGINLLPSLTLEQKQTLLTLPKLGGKND